MGGVAEVVEGETQAIGAEEFVRFAKHNVALWVTFVAAVAAVIQLITDQISPNAVAVSALKLTSATPLNTSILAFATIHNNPTWVLLAK